jgi:hypothetical protein
MATVVAILNTSIMLNQEGEGEEGLGERTVANIGGMATNVDISLEIGRGKGTARDDEVISAFLSVPRRIPNKEKEFSIDADLARIAAETAFERDVGKMEVVHGLMGKCSLRLVKI